MNSTIIARSLTVCGLLVIAACAPLGKQAPLEQPTAYSLSQGSSTKEARDAWWAQLRDPKLDTLVSLAIEHSPRLKVAKARFAQAQAELGVKQAADQFQLGITAQGIGAYVTPKPSSSRLDTDRTLLLANTALQGSWAFDFWGKNQARIRSALGRRQAVAYEAAQTRLEIAHVVAAQYFAWQALEAQKNLIENRVSVAESSEKLLNSRVQAKILPASSLYQAELAKNQLQLELLKLEKNISNIRHSLAVSVGKAPNALDGWTPSPMTAVPALAVNQIKADLLGKRPDIAAQRALLEARSEDVREAKAEFYPNIELKLLAGLAHVDAFNVVKGKSSAMLGVLPALNLPLFTSGALQSKLAGRHAQFNEQVALYDQTVLNAMRSAADAMADYQNLTKQGVLQQRMVEVSGKAEAAAARRVRAGLENGLTHLAKQDETLRLKIQLAQHQAEWLTAWSNVHAQLGGGFSRQSEYSK
ncbi:outer membrane efflux protein [Neisseria zoodegmatis]|uniref:Outer membrane efflux protein n=1 Tax=Neisseria zoodegmatis TaxID=326523 RepID=A0A378X5G6_9NEIS|nr:efflux transporter outer membrane subunit [Neisseria zoodegmatis]SUA48860.1 outer membrane efflux protein [Neisseria zoodegmatis]